MMQRRDKTQNEKSAKPDVKPKANKQVNPSQTLANLLRKEAMFAARVRKAKEDLKAVQDDIRQAWKEREQVAEELLGNDLDI